MPLTAPDEPDRVKLVVLMVDTSIASLKVTKIFESTATPVTSLAGLVDDTVGAVLSYSVLEESVLFPQEDKKSAHTNESPKVYFLRHNPSVKSECSIYIYRKFKNQVE